MNYSNGNAKANVNGNAKAKEKANAKANTKANAKANAKKPHSQVRDPADAATNYKLEITARSDQAQSAEWVRTPYQRLKSGWKKHE